MITENSAEVVPVWKYFVLHGKKCPPGIDKIYARKTVYLSDLLRSNVFLYSHRIIRPAFHSGVIGHKKAFSPIDYAYPRDDAR